MGNPFSAVWASLTHLATQARRLGDAFGQMAEQVEQRSVDVGEPEALQLAPPAPAAEQVNGRRATKVAGAR